MVPRIRSWPISFRELKKYREFVTVVVELEWTSIQCMIPANDDIQALRARLSLQRSDSLFRTGRDQTVALGSAMQSVAPGSLCQFAGSRSGCPFHWLRRQQSGSYTRLSKFNKGSLFPSGQKTNFHSRFNNSSALGNMLKNMHLTLYIWKKIILFGPKCLERHLFNKFMAKCSMYSHGMARRYFK